MTSAPPQSGYVPVNCPVARPPASSTASSRIGRTSCPSFGISRCLRIRTRQLPCRRSRTPCATRLRLTTSTLTGFGGAGLSLPWRTMRVQTSGSTDSSARTTHWLARLTCATTGKQGIYDVDAGRHAKRRAVLLRRVRHEQINAGAVAFGCVSSPHLLPDHFMTARADQAFVGSRRSWRCLADMRRVLAHVFDCDGARRSHQARVRRPSSIARSAST